MKYEYDEETDGLYIWFVDDIETEKTDYEREVWPEELKNEIGILLKKNGQLLGLEIQPASVYFSTEQLNKMKTAQ